MTDTQLAPTDADLLSLNEGEVYFSESPSKYPKVHGTQYHAGAPGVIAFARAVLARWGQPAHSGEPVAFIHWPVSGPPRLVWHSQKALNDAILKSYKGYQPDVKLYTAPQPVEREPLTDEQSHGLLERMADEADKWAEGLSYEPTCKQVSGWCVAFLMRELPIHGIKGGQHGTDI